jgi:protein TonB
VVVGLTLDSTTTSGSFAAAVGNTLYGKTDKVAHDAASVKPYGAAKYVPSFQVDTLPQPIGDIQRPEYPEGARRDQIEGVVLLAVTIGPSGDVVDVKMLKKLDPRLDPLAVEAIRRSHWRPAVVKGERVATEIKYSFRFELDR